MSKDSVKMGLKRGLKISGCEPRSALSLIGYAVAFSLIASPAFAASGGHHEASVSSLFLPAINFTLYILLMYKLLNRPIATVLRGRKDSLEAHIKRAAMRWDQARTQLLDVQRRFQSLDKDVQEISERIASEARQEAQTLVADAKAKAELMIKRAEEGALAERRAAEIQLREELAQKVIEIASQKLSSEMTPDSDRPLRERALDGIRVIG